MHSAKALVPENKKARPGIDRGPTGSRPL